MAMAEISGMLAEIAPRLRSGALLESCQAAVSDNPPWESAAGRYLIVRLSPVRDMASSAGHVFLHRLLRSTLGPGAFIDFSFMPAKTDRRELSAAGIPLMHGILGMRGAADYDAVLMSCSYAPELVNVPILLEGSGMPVRASDRRGSMTDGRPWPAVILGGSNALASQALLFDDGDSFVDGIFFGEGEGAATGLVRELDLTRGIPAGERAARLAAACPSFWPSGSLDGPQVTVARCMDADETPSETAHPILNTPEADTARLQTSRGCPSTCTFCFEGWEHKPYREIPAATILERARELAIGTGANSIELLSFNFNAHTDIAKILTGLNRVFERVGMLSQSADLLLTTPRMIDFELAAGKSSFTIGVEGISEGMRELYSKGLSGQTLCRVLERLARERVREIKLFYILAGIETDDDVSEFESFVKFLAGLRQRNDSALKLNFSFGYLVRMPFTPLRGAGLCLDRKRLQALAERLARIVESAGFESRLAAGWDEYVADQILVLGPYGMASALQAAGEAGVMFYGGFEGDIIRFLKAFLVERGLLDPGGMTGPFVERKPDGWKYPFDFVQAAVGPEVLDARLSDAERRVGTPSCMGGFDPAAPHGSCRGCGACGESSGRSFLTGHSIDVPAPGQVQELAELVRAKRRMRPRYMLARIPPVLSGSTSELLRAWLLRSALSRRPELVGKLFRVEEALWSSPAWRDRAPAGITGLCLLGAYGIDLQVGGEPPCLCDSSLGLVADALGEATGHPVECFEAVDLPEVGGIDLVLKFPGILDERAFVGLARSWLAALKLNATERRQGDGRLFEVAPKDAKKRIVASILVVPSSGMMTVRGGARIDFAPLFSRPGDQAGVRVEVTRLGLA